MSEILVGRQPIFDRKLDVHGYELLFRGGTIDFDDPSSGDRATSQVIVNAFTEIGLETLVGQRRAFLNLTRSFIVGENALPFSPREVTLEVLESVPCDAEVLAGLQHLKDKGFQIALDDFEFAPEREALIPLADMIKLDVLGQTDEVIDQRVERLRPYATRLLAEKVETREQFESCRDMGFQFFQGFFLEKPSIVETRSISPQVLTLMQLLNELHSPGFTFNHAEEIVRQDLGLCYRLLRHINSALYGMPREISSVREALIYLGIQNVQNLTSLFLLAATEDTPKEMIAIAMLRARMCELIGNTVRAQDANRFFIVGLFSTLDAILGLDMDDLLSRLPLTPEQEAALRKRTGPMGKVLRSVIAYEHGDWDNVECFGLSASEIQDIYLDALRWSQELSSHDANAA